MKKFFLKRKHSGSSGAGEIIATSLCLVVILSVLLIFVHFSKIIKVKENIDLCGREALLLLEEQGELTPEQLNEIKTSVGEHFANYTVTYNGNNTKAKHGEDVSITIYVKASWQELGITKVMEIIQDYYEFTTEYHSISKARIK